MATRFYFRSTTANVGSHARTELSTALPVGTFDDSGNVAQDLGLSKGASEVTRSNASLAQTAQQSQYMGKHISIDLTGVGTITAQTWTVAFDATEGAAQANAFCRVSVYVVTSADAVRGFVYDGAADLGVEFDATGQVVTFSGSAVAGILDTDRLVCELWIVATQAMATAYTNTYAYDGATDVTESTSSDAASYIETPQNMFPPSITAASLGDSGRDWDVPFQEVSITFSEAIEKSGGVAYGVGDTIPGLTIGPSGTEGAVTYRSGDSTTGWVVRRAALAKNGDTWVIDYARSTGELVADGGGTELEETTNAAITNNLTKRVRFIAKDAAGSPITTACSLNVARSSNTPGSGTRDADNSGWMVQDQRTVNLTPSGTGLVDVEYVGAMNVGDYIYVALFNPREDLTGTGQQATIAFIWPQLVT